MLNQPKKGGQFFAGMQYQFSNVTRNGKIFVKIAEMTETVKMTNTGNVTDMEIK